MARWLTLEKACKRLRSGREVDIDEMIEMAIDGKVRLGARIPTWQSPGVGELEWFYPDGSKASVSTDGVARWMDRIKLELLTLHGKVALGGVSWHLDTGEGAGPAITAGPTSPSIVVDDLRILESELPRIVALLEADPIPVRANEGGATGDRFDVRFIEPDPGAPLLQQWQDLAAQVYELRAGLGSLPPTEQEALYPHAATLEARRQELEANPEYHDALTSYIRYLEGDLAKQQNAELRVRTSGQIASWRAHLARITSKLTAEERQLEEGEPVTKQGKNPRKRVEDWVRWAAEHLAERDVNQAQLAEKIFLRAEKLQIESERGTLTVANIMRMLPRGSAGRRGRPPGSQSKK
ncbi:hypothetical protein [Aromatoleum sp.]|uniref:hypothetical protein n=1 Tax=Aromatoleum sp. TaxID=2307007 RepID=UPI002FCA9F59